jgi:nucleoside-diphosphate-sugar epimerase
MKILVTGANGFIGKFLTKYLAKYSHEIISVTRNISNDSYAVGDIDENTNWTEVLTGCDVIVHLAARVHQMHDDSLDPLSEFRRVNTAGTLNLARQAMNAGVKRFIFISSIKVNGEESDFPYSEMFEPNPSDAYAISKWEAEQGLNELSRDGAMEVVIIRPPLIYGPRVKANFASMIRWVTRGVPLPFGAIHNKRSMVAVENLVDFIVLCADISKSPKAANQIFLISDGADVSTTELLNNVRAAYGTKMPLIPIPGSWLKFTLNLIGKSELSSRLLGSLTVDISKARNLLGWEPKIDILTQLRKMAANKL